MSGCCFPKKRPQRKRRRLSCGTSRAQQIDKSRQASLVEPRSFDHGHNLLPFRLYRRLAQRPHGHSPPLSIEERFGIARFMY